MQGIDIQFAEQVPAGDQGNTEQQQRHSQADGLTVFADEFKPMHAAWVERLGRGCRALDIG
ncbi:hypothetical protein D9M71_267190 [compost metagenome]